MKRAIVNQAKLLSAVAALILLMVVASHVAATEVCSGCTYVGQTADRDTSPPFPNCPDTASRQDTVYNLYYEECVDPDTGTVTDHFCYKTIDLYICHY
jgi:hypothetical protein